jgi:NAD(P)-dependent dehydrogenase (short-subunit alcohol dehydrogenase family)
MTVVDEEVLAGRTAVISGGSRGIGLSIARTLARAGANIDDRHPRPRADRARPHCRRKLPVAPDGDRDRACAELAGRGSVIAQSRTPQIVADAAGIVLRRDPAAYTGNAVIVEDLLAEGAITDLSPYDVAPGQTAFMPHFFVDPARLGQEPANPLDLAGGRP